MSDKERDRVLARIADIEQTLRETESEDVRDVLLHAMADAQERLREQDAQASQGPASGATEDGSA